MTALPEPLRSMVFRNDDLPELFHHTDAVAVARQREAVNTTRAQLALLVAGTVPAALPWHAEDGPAARALYGAAVLAYLGVLFTTFLASQRKAKSHWQLNRSAAEFIKSNCWRYAVHGAPFDSASEHPEALFANRLEDGLQELRKVGWADPREELPDSGGLITDSMRALRNKAYTVRKETYVRDRLIEQRRWYRRRQQASRRGALMWSGAIVALTLPALALSVLQTFSGPVVRSDGGAVRGGGGLSRLERDAPAPSADLGALAGGAGPGVDAGRHGDHPHRTALAGGGVRDRADRVARAHRLAGQTPRVSPLGSAPAPVSPAAPRRARSR